MRLTGEEPVVGRVSVTPDGWQTSPRRALVAVAVIGAVAGSASILLDWRLLVPIALGVPLALMAVLASSAPSDDGPASSGPVFGGILHDVRWLAASLVLAATFAGVGVFEGIRDASAAATGTLSLDNLVELLAVGMGALTLVSALRQGWRRRVPPYAWLFVAYAVLALASVTWSQMALFSAVRAFEFAVLAGVAAYGAVRAASERGFADRLLVQVVRLLTAVVGVLAVTSLLQDGLAYERFSFRGTHANTAASMMLLVMLAVAFHPQRARITRPIPWWLVLAGLAPLVYLAGSRVYPAAALGALAAGAAVAGLKDKRVGALNAAIGSSALALVAYFASEQVAEFIRREQDDASVRGLNGRLELWDWILSNPAGSEVYGVGIGAVRGGLPISWDATNAHSAWIEILQTLGVLGLALMGALVLTLTVLALLRRSVQGTWMITFVIVSSVTSVTISQPGAPLMLLTLCIIVLAVPVAGDRRHGASLADAGQAQHGEAVAAPSVEGR